MTCPIPLIFTLFSLSSLLRCAFLFQSAPHTSSHNPISSPPFPRAPSNALHKPSPPFPFLPPLSHYLILSPPCDLTLFLFMFLLIISHLDRPIMLSHLLTHSLIAHNLIPHFVVMSLDLAHAANDLQAHMRKSFVSCCCCSKRKKKKGHLFPAFPHPLYGWYHAQTRYDAQG